MTCNCSKNLADLEGELVVKDHDAEGEGDVGFFMVKVKHKSRTTDQPDEEISMVMESYIHNFGMKEMLLSVTRMMEMCLGGEGVSVLETKDLSEAE